jgi:hypothetical protein
LGSKTGLDTLSTQQGNPAKEQVDCDLTAEQRAINPIKIKIMSVCNIIVAYNLDNLIEEGHIRSKRAKLSLR